MKKSFVKRLVALALVIVSVFSVSAVAFAETITGTYNTKAVNLRLRPGSSSIGQVNKNSTCTVHGYRDVSGVRWYKVTILTGDSELNGKSGWSLASLITVSNPNAVPFYSYTNNPTRAFGSSNLQQGSAGNGVRNLQVCLNAKGYNIAIDGDFGPATLSAVNAYQTSEGYTATGIVNSTLKNVLINDSVCLNALNTSGY